MRLITIFSIIQGLCALLAFYQPAFFGSKSSKTSQNTTNTTTVGASEDSIAAAGDIYFQDPGIVDVIKTVSANTQNIASSVLGQAGKQFEDASRLANANTNKEQEVMKLATWGLVAWATVKLGPEIIKAIK